MIGKTLTDPNTLKGALKNLSNEIKPNSPPASSSPNYRKNLALSLFYKVLISYYLFYTLPRSFIVLSESSWKC